MRDYVLLFINGKPHKINGPDAFIMLADFLRYRLKLTGTKIVCAEGDCGACTVLLKSAMGATTGVERFVPINSCVSLVAQLDTAHIITVEGLKRDGQLSEIQNAL